MEAIHIKDIGLNCVRIGVHGIISENIMVLIGIIIHGHILYIN